MLPNLRVQNLGASLKILSVDNTDLTRNKRFSFLTEDVVAGGTTIRLQSIIGFEQLSTSSGQIVAIGNIANERTEIQTTSLTTSPSYSYKEVALAAPLQFDHPQDTKVSIVDWNRVDFYYSGTASGTKSTLTAYPVYIQADISETPYRETVKDQVFYFARYNDSTATRYSDYSDAVYSTGYDDNSVFNIKKRALDELGEVVDGNIITNEFLNQSLWEARREYHNSIGKRPFRRKYNVVIGSVTTGMYRTNLPTDVERPFTAENVYGVRIGTNMNMEYYDKKEWDFDFINKPHSTLAVAYVTTHQDLYLDNVRDFGDSGSVMIESDTIVYSARGISGGTLRISTAGSSNHAVNSDVWQNASFGLPNKFTVFTDSSTGSAYIYFNRIVDTAYVDQNIFADYYRTLVGYNSDNDILDEPKYDMYVPFLKARIKQRRMKGMNDVTQDADYKLWQFEKDGVLKTEFIGAQIRINPGIEHLPFPN